MKFGFRKPSIKRSISAMTTGALKRAIMREIIPGYGQRGMGWITNPKKAAYNRLYNAVTVAPADLLKEYRPQTQSNYESSIITEAEINRRERAITIRNIGLEQLKIPQELIQMVINETYFETDLYKAINRLNTYVSGYLNQSLYEGIDYCDMAEDRLLNIKRINPKVKEIALAIVGYIRQNKTSKEIFEIISQLN